jgi:hypothetical protein
MVSNSWVHGGIGAFRPVVDSWDVFDTLITRITRNPLDVFTIVQQRHPETQFFERRLRAQQALDAVGQPYVIYDIYAEMKRQGLNASLARHLLREELQVEREMLLPIRRNLNRVRPMDLLVSDMYLPAEIISSLLTESCGLVHRPIIRSNWGKHSGTIWPSMLKHYVLRCHHGDNPHADRDVPASLFIPVELVDDAELTPWENQLAAMGQPALAASQREARLRGVAAGFDEFQRAVTGPYLTMLVAYASFLVHEFGLDRRFVFLSRDANDLLQVFHALHPAVNFTSLDLSRRLIKEEETDDVFRAHLTPDSIIVDLVATGRSVLTVMRRLGIHVPFMLLLFNDLLLTEDWFEGHRWAEDNGILKYAVRQSDFRDVDLQTMHQSFEAIMQSMYPVITALSHDPASGGLVRAYGEDDLTAGEAALIQEKIAIVTEFIASLRRRDFVPPGREESIALLKASLDGLMSARLKHAFPSFHIREQANPF